jgi:hypothetical protein
MISSKSLTALLLDQFGIDTIGQQRLLEWEALVLASSKSQDFLSPDEWNTEINKVWAICQSHCPNSRRMNLDPMGLFPEIVEQWRLVLMGQRPSLKISRPGSIDMSYLLSKYLNLENGAIDKLRQMENAWKSSISRGSPLSVMVEVIRRKCRSLCEKGYYDPNNQLEGLVELWFYSIHDEHTHNVVLSVINSVFRESTPLAVQ